jgi:hypothetical protein
MRSERFEMVQYLVLEAGVIVWHIGPNSVTAHNVFLPRTQVMSKLRRYRKASRTAIRSSMKRQPGNCSCS